MSKLINKLVNASGGWEPFLLQTLWELCEAVDLTDVNASTAEEVLYAKDVLKAYEEMEAVDTGVDEKKVKPIPVIKTMATVAVEADEVPMDKLEPSNAPANEVAKVAEPETPRPRPVPRKKTGRVAVDKEVGASRGQLPVPLGCKIVNRERLVIATTSRAELGRGSHDGQVRGSEVSGHVRTDGTYRLVFKDTNLGVGLVQYEVVEVERNGK